MSINRVEVDSLKYAYMNCPSIIRSLLAVGLLYAPPAAADSLFAASLSADSVPAYSLSAAFLSADSLSAASLLADSVPADSLSAASLSADSVLAYSLSAASLSADSVLADSLSAPSSADRPYLVAEPMPSFNGGDVGDFCRWVQERVVYPDEAIAYGIEGRVTLAFVVERDGTLSGIEPLTSPDPVLSDAVIRVVRQSPRWSPGMLEGKPVRVRLTVPVEFNLQTDPAQTTIRDGSLPSFQGGDLIAFKRWVLRNLDFPDTTFNFGDEGWVDAEFAVSRKGKVRMVEIPRFSDPDFADLIGRTLAASPLWIPGINSAQTFYELRFDLLLRRGEKGLYSEDNSVYTEADTLPRFRGGTPAAFREWVYAKVDSLLGSDPIPQVRIVVRFDIERDGTVTGIRVGQVQGHESFSQVVRRALDEVPPWSPAVLAGEKVRFRITQLFDFSRSGNPGADASGLKP